MKLEKLSQLVILAVLGLACPALSGGPVHYEVQPLIPPKTQVPTTPAPKPTPPPAHLPPPTPTLTLGQLGQLSNALSPAQLQQAVLQLTSADPLTDASPLTNNTALYNVTPFTMPIGNNFTMPIGNNFSTQNVGDPTPMIRTAFRSALGRDPTPGELQSWASFKDQYPKLSVTLSAGNLAEALGYYRNAVSQHQATAPQAEYQTTTPVKKGRGANLKGGHG